MKRTIALGFALAALVCAYPLASSRFVTHNGGRVFAQAGQKLPAIPAPQSQNLTLSRARDYRHVGGNVDCPNCKDLYCATIQTPIAGTRFVSTQYRTMRSQGHWYRCQIQAKCGRAEFSDPNVPEQDCAGKQSCNICRATDDATEAEDDITVTYQ